MLSFIGTNLLWVHGLPIVYVLVILGVISFFIYRPFSYIIVGLFLFSFYFFRNPERTCYQLAYDSSVIVCPTDGTVVDIVQSEKPIYKNFTQKVAIFLSALDVHVQWAPIDGIVQDVTYKPGRFLLAFLPKSSELNEHNDVVIKNAQNQTILVRQIAGTVARRICCWVQKKQQLHAGDKFGMIRFGSRVEVFLPSNVELVVGIGQKVVGGQTVLGKWLG